ncbi:MAG: ester cyclase [Chloroflexota bacterium]|nr:ester cyclase [Chloroflexota bacterium]
MSLAANKATFRKIPEQIYNRGELNLARSVMVPNYIEHLRLPEGLAAGRAGFEEFVQLWRTAVPDLTYKVTHLTPDFLIGEGELVVLRIEGRGTHRGPLLGVAPTGRPMDWTETHMGRFGNGLLVEHWAEIDKLRILQALGTVEGFVPRGPAPPPVIVDERYLTSAELRDLLSRLVEEVWNEGRLEVADEIFHPKATTPGAPEQPLGPGGVQAAVAAFRAGFSDYRVSIEDTVVEYPYMAGRLRRTGTHDGSYGGLAPTGRGVSYGEILIVRVGNGQIVESWSDADTLGLLDQLQAEGEASGPETP